MFIIHDDKVPFAATTQVSVAVFVVAAKVEVLRLKLLLSQYNFNSSICSNLQCCYSSSIAVRAMVNTVNTLAIQVLLV